MNPAFNPQPADIEKAGIVAVLVVDDAGDPASESGSPSRSP